MSLQDLPSHAREYKSNDPNVRLADERLDPAMAENYRHFIDLAERAHRVSDDNHNAKQGGRRALDEAKRRKAFFDAEYTDRGMKPPAAELKAHEIAVAEAEKAYRAAHRRPKPFHIDTDALDNFVRKLDPDKAKLADVPPVDEFESLASQREEATAEVESARQQLADAETLPRDKSVGVEKIKREIAAAIERGTPKVAGLFRADDFSDRGSFRPSPNTGTIKWPVQYAHPIQGGDGIAVPDPLALIAFFFPDVFEKKMLELVESAAPTHGVTLEEKVKRVSEAQARVAAALRKENAILMALEARGELFHRKRKYHPAVMLGIEWPAQKIAEF